MEIVNLEGASRSARDILKTANRSAEVVRHKSNEIGISRTLLMMVTNGSVTHPNIARRIADAYHLTEEQYYELIPKNYRPGPDYDPDKFTDIDMRRPMGTKSGNTNGSKDI